MKKKYELETLEHLVNTRYSVRTYQQKPLTEDEVKEIEKLLGESENPFSVPVKIHLVMLGNAKESGTFAAGATCFFAFTAPEAPLCYEAIGYEGEALSLALLAKGFGTCWIGRFRRETFWRHVPIEHGEVFPVVMAVGHFAKEKNPIEKSLRLFWGAGKRKAWNTLFFDAAGHSIANLKSQEVQIPLQMLRKAPSARNGQPWRIVIEKRKCHFYSAEATLLSRIDLGVAAAHFALTTRAMGINGTFSVRNPLLRGVFEREYHYLFTWNKEDLENERN